VNSERSQLRNLLARARSRIPFLKLRPLRTLAARGQWDELYRLGVVELPEHAQLKSGLELICEGARRTGQEGDLWSRLSGLLQPQPEFVDQAQRQLAHSAEERFSRQVTQMLAEGQVLAAAELFRDQLSRFGTVPRSPGLELVTNLRNSQFQRERCEVAQSLARLFPEDPSVAREMMLAFISTQDWDRAWEIYEHHGSALEPHDAVLRSAIIRLLVHCDRGNDAQRLLERDFPDGNYPPELWGVVCGLWSEQGNWPAIYRLAIEDPARLPPNSFLLYRVILAARATRQIPQLLQALLDTPTPRAPHLTQMIDALGEDLAVAGVSCELSAGFCRPLESRLDRIRLKSPSIWNSLPTCELGIFYCCDAAFLRPTVVSLVSLCLSNPLLIRKARISVLAAPDVLPKLGPLARHLEPLLGVAIEVLSATELIPDSSQLRSDYGIYTGGRSLSPAAFYRIFMAQHLLRAKRYREGLYLDGDTLIRAGLDHLFAHPMHQPLMARPESDRSVIRRAVADHRMKGWYFNSGVLRFDFGHPSLPRLLEQSLENTLDPGRKLHFHDQCAMNIAFDGQVEMLPERFNQFLSPKSMTGKGDHPEGVILHFVDQPKPWDSFFPDGAKLWFETLQVVHNLLGTEAARLL